METGNEKPQETPTGDLAGEIVAQIENNQAAAVANQTGEAPKPAWCYEPLANFETDGEKPRLDKSGNPIRRGGRPRKAAKPGERLAGGGVAEGEPPDVSPRVSMGDDAPPLGESDSIAAGPEQLGEDGGAVIAEAAVNADAPPGPRANHVGEISPDEAPHTVGKKLW